MKGILKRLIVLMMVFCMTAVYMPSFSFAEDESTATPGTETVTQDPGEEDPENPDQQNGETQIDENAQQPAEQDAPKDDTQDKPQEQTAAPDTKTAAPIKKAPVLKAGNSCSYTSKLVDINDDRSIRTFKATINGKSLSGTCAEIGDLAKSSGTATYTKISNTSRHAKLIYYYGYVKGWWNTAEGKKSAKSELGVDFSVTTTKKELVEYMNQISRQGSSWKSKAVSGAGFTESFAKTIYDYVTDRDVSNVTVPDGFELYFCDTGNDGQNFSVWDYNPNGYVCVQKNAATTETNFLNIAPNNYSLAGAVYWLYTDAACTARAKDANGNYVVLTTTASGRTNAVAVEAGTYYAKEVTASKGFKIDPGVKPIVVSTSNTQNSPATVTSTEVPAYAYPEVKVEKIDKDGNLGWKKLIGAKYTLNYYDVAPGTTDLSGKEPKKTWTFTTREMGNEGEKKYAGFDLAIDEPEEGNDSFWTENGKRVLPVGVFTIEEKQAPPGLAVDETVKIGKIYQPSNGADAEATSVSNFEYTEGPDTPIDTYDEEQAVILKVKKVDKKTGESTPQGNDREYSKGSLAGAEYDVYFDGPLQQEREKVGTITTDENGDGELSAKENGDKLELGTYYIKEVKPSPGYTLDETEYTIVARAKPIVSNTVEYSVTSPENDTETFFYKTDITTGEELPGATLQVINSDDQIVEEWVSTDEPHKIAALPAGTYTLREITAPQGYDVAEDVEFEIVENKLTTKVTMKNGPIDIHTTATDVETGTHQGTFSAEEKIKDVVKFENLYAGRTYTFTGTLMDKKTGEALTGADGQEITAEKEYTVPGEEGKLVSGEVELEFTVDASQFTKDKSVVAFETISRDGRELAIHADLKDDDQTIHYGGIVKTTATDENLLSHNVLAGENCVIIDTVEYQNLSTKETYTLEAELFDKTTGASTGITAKANFTPEAENGTTEVKFVFDATAYKNHELVVFETLKLNDTTIDEHKDPEDKEQTVYVPEIGTKIGKPSGRTVKDTVSYQNLIPGKTYVMKGWLVDKNGKKIKGSDGSKKFTPTSPNGTVVVTLKLKGYKGTAVAFEECYAVGKVKGKDTETLVGEHKDPKDKDQTVVIKGKGPKTGEGLPMLPLYGSAVGLAALLYAIIRKLKLSR